jgi:hypothetical protein
MKNEIELEIKLLINNLKKNKKKLANINSESKELNGCNMLVELFSEADDLTSSDSYNINPVFKSLRGGYLSYRDDNGYSNSVDVVIGESGKGDFFYNFDLDEADAWFIELQKDSLKYISRKHPSIFKSMMKKRHDLSPPEEAKQIYDNIMEISNIIKGKYKSEVLDFIINEDLKKKVFLEFIKSKGTNANIHDLILGFNAETLYDLAQHLKEEQMVYTFINKVTSKKSKDLINKKSHSYIKEITRLGITDKEFKASFSNKISKYKTKKELELGLQKYLQTLAGWSKNALFKKLEIHEIFPEEIYDDIIMFEVEDFKTMQKIGSSQWCIATDEVFFEQYVDKKEYTRQMMVLDFNRESDDPLSMIGVTIDVFGNHLNAHDKNDINLLTGSRRNDVLMETIKQKTRKYNEIELTTKIIERINTSYLFFSENELDIELFKELSSLQLINNSHFKKYEKGVINFLRELNDVDISISKKTDCIKKIIDQTSISKNNISDVFKCIEKSGIEVSKLIDFNSIRAVTLIKKERDSNLLNSFVEQYKGNKWELFADLMVSEFEDFNLKILKSLYEHDRDNFWPSFHQAVSFSGMLQPIFFEDDDVFKFMKDKDIPDEVVLGVINNSNISKYGSNVEKNILTHLRNKSEEDLEKITHKMSSDLSLNAMLFILDNNIISEEQYFENIKFGLNYNKDKKAMGNLTRLYMECNEHKLYKTTIDFIIKNTEDINSMFNCLNIIKKDEIRKLFLDKGVMDKNIYTSGYFFDGNLEKEGLPIVMECIEDLIKLNSNQKIDIINTNARVKNLYDDILKNEWLNQKELKNMLIEKIPSLSEKIINNLPKDKKTIKIQH